MKSLNKLTMSLFVLLFHLPAIADTCPTSPTHVSPVITSKVTYDSKSGQYHYEYTISNARDAELAIERFIILSSQAPIDIKSPAHWNGDFIDLPEFKKNIVWDTFELDPNDPRTHDRNYKGPQLKLFYSIKPGGKLSGYSFKSPLPPGPAYYFAEGETEPPTTVAREGDDEPEPDCPGFDEGPRFKTMRGGVTEGPLSPGTIPVSLRLVKSSGERRPHECNPDRDSGEISVLLLPSRNFDPSTLTLSSVKFGYGEAPVLSSKPLPSFKDRESEWCAWENSRKRNHPDFAKDDERARAKKKPLLLTFDIQTVGIRCGLDEAIFLTGKTEDGKTAVGSVPISPRDCKPWTRHGLRGSKRSDPRKPPFRSKHFDHR